MPGGIDQTAAVRRGLLLQHSDRPHSVHVALLLPLRLLNPAGLSRRQLLPGHDKPTGLRLGRLLSRRQHGSARLPGLAVLLHSRRRTAVPRWQLLPPSLCRTDAVPRRIILPGEQRRADELPCRIILPSEKRRAHELHRHRRAVLRGGQLRYWRLSAEIFLHRRGVSGRLPCRLLLPRRFTRRPGLHRRRLVVPIFERRPF